MYWWLSKTEQRTLNSKHSGLLTELRTHSGPIFLWSAFHRSIWWKERRNGTYTYYGVSSTWALCSWLVCILGTWLQLPQQQHPTGYIITSRTLYHSCHVGTRRHSAPYQREMSSAVPEKPRDAPQYLKISVCIKVNKSWQMSRVYQLYLRWKFITKFQLVCYLDLQRPWMTLKYRLRLQSLVYTIRILRAANCIVAAYNNTVT